MMIHHQLLPLNQLQIPQLLLPHIRIPPRKFSRASLLIPMLFRGIKSVHTHKRFFRGGLLTRPKSHGNPRSITGGSMTRPYIMIYFILHFYRVLSASTRAVLEAVCSSFTLITLAGQPATTVLGATSPTTMAPAATTAS